MVSKEELQKIVMLGYLKDDMLEKMVPVIDVLNFDEREIIFKGGERSDRFYMLKRGKILLEKRMTDKITISVGTVKAGYAFGWSAMFDDKGIYTSEAVCAEPCEVFSMRGTKIRKILDKNPSMGYIFTQRLLRTLKSRLDHRTTQFLRTIKNHPEIQSLIEE